MVIDIRNENSTLANALSRANPGDVILLGNRTYNEKVDVVTPNLTLIGAEKTIISFDAAHNKIRPIELGGDGQTPYGTTGSATFTVKVGADGFNAKNITFMNTYKRNGQKYGQAVAFKAEISNLFIDNCRFIGEQDTLYIDYGKSNIIRNSYIEGDVDFIFGSGDCCFISCDILALNIMGRAYITAPDTFVSNTNGLVFIDCDFKMQDGLECYLGRAWFPGGNGDGILPRTTCIKCRFDDRINLKLIQMHDNDPTHFEYKIIE